MRYMMLIYHGSTPLPGTPEWDSLAQEQRDAVASGYRNLNQADGVTESLTAPTKPSGTPRSVTSSSQC